MLKPDLFFFTRVASLIHVLGRHLCRTKINSLTTSSSNKKCVLKLHVPFLLLRWGSRRGGGQIPVSMARPRQTLCCTSAALRHPPVHSMVCPTMPSSSPSRLIRVQSPWHHSSISLSCCHILRASMPLTWPTSPHPVCSCWSNAIRASIPRTAVMPGRLSRARPSRASPAPLAPEPAIHWRMCPSRCPWTQASCHALSGFASLRLSSTQKWKQASSSLKLKGSTMGWRQRPLTFRSQVISTHLLQSLGPQQMAVSTLMNLRVMDFHPEVGQTPQQKDIGADVALMAGISSRNHSSSGTSQPMLEHAFCHCHRQMAQIAPAAAAAMARQITIAKGLRKGWRTSSSSSAPLMSSSMRPTCQTMGHTAWTTLWFITKSLHPLSPPWSMRQSIALMALWVIHGMGMMGMARLAATGLTRCQCSRKSCSVTWCMPSGVLPSKGLVHWSIFDLSMGITSEIL